ncbi:Lactose regulatory protein LAC9 [Apiospora arundinis]|uniref:Lactose regulatory protein LAC9 n=1 Tax=Apiospora arundinis TaxID=335852 RepID=A0ABR2JIB6_9PEZI
MELRSIPPTVSAERFIQSVWDLDSADSDLQSLTHYMAHVNGEIHTACRQERIHANSDQWPKLIIFLRKRLNVSRAEICRDLPDQGLRSFPESALDLMIRIIFAIATLPDSAIGGQLFRPRWKTEESIAALIDRVFPQRLPDDITSSDTQRVKMQKMSMSYVTQYTHVEIQWTDYLSDHLLLSTGINWKRLYVFRHPAFIHTALKHLEGKGAVTDAEALSQGCLPPGLMKETLATLNVLFPSADKRSRLLLEKEVNLNNLDVSLLEPLPPDHSYHETQRDALLPSSVSALYQKFPYWGERLYDLWIEAEDPTPITTVGKWSDSKKSGRYVYWAGFMALVIAIIFGIAATALAAVQVWISWCAWVADPSRPSCSTKS